AQGAPDLALPGMAVVVVELRAVEQLAMVVWVVLVVVDEFLEGVEAAPDVDHLVDALLDEFHDADDLVDALPGQILEVAGLVEDDDAVQDGADAIVGARRHAGGTQE